MATAQINSRQLVLADEYYIEIYLVEKDSKLGLLPLKTVFIHVAVVHIIFTSFFMLHCLLAHTIQ